MSRWREGGFSLHEVLVTVSLLGLVMLFVYRTLFAVLGEEQSQSERLENLAEARVVMAVLTKDLRTATRLTAEGSAFLVADAREVRFYANLDNDGGPRLVHIFVDSNSRLVEQVVDPSGSAPDYTYTGTPSVRIVGRYIVPDRPIFTYYDDTGEALQSPLSAEDMVRVRSVGIDLAVRRGRSPELPAVVLASRVRLPNLDYNPLVEDS